MVLPELDYPLNMEPDELTLSDVHVGQSMTLTGYSTAGYPVYMSRFMFLSDKPDLTSYEPQQELNSCIEVDEDGDLLVTRKLPQDLKSDIVYIEHTMSTRLKDVGLQVWQGCLLMCDFILYRKEAFNNVVALELGSGVGLAGVVMATIAKHVFCTDLGNDILSTCARNAELNSSLYQHQQQGTVQQNIVRVRQLDWTSKNPFQVREVENHGEFDWTKDDQTMLRDTTVLFAADVIYDEKLTDAFFQTVVDFVRQHHNCILYITLECRLNFSLSELEVCCPAYTHFQSWISKMSSPDASLKGNFQVEQLSTDFPQFFQYSRTKYLELWKIQSCFENG